MASAICQWKFIVLKNRMYFNIDKVPLVVRVCVVQYNFILYHEGVASDGVFTVDAPTRRARGSRSDVAAEAAVATVRDREAQYLADKYLVATWGEEGSAQDRARLAAEARYRAQPEDEGGGGEDDGEAVVLPSS